MTSVDEDCAKAQSMAALDDEVDRNTRPDMNGADLLRTFRRTHGWTVRQAAEKTGVPASTWHGWEGGKPMPQQRFLELLLRSVIAATT